MAPGLGGSPKLLEGSLRLPAGPLHPLSDDGLPPAGSRSGWAVRLLVTGARGRSTTTASIDSSTAVGLVVISSITVRAFSAIAKIGRLEMNPWRRETGSNRRCQVSHIRPGVPPTSIGDRLELTTVRPWPPATTASRWRSGQNCGQKPSPGAVCCTPRHGKARGQDYARDGPLLL